MRSFDRLLIIAIAIITASYTAVNAQAFSADESGKIIEQKIERELKMLPRYEVFDYIDYKVDGSTVTLYGKVINGINKSDARNRVAAISGVERVVDNIDLLPPGRFDDVIRRNLYRSLANTGGLSRYLWPVNPPVRLIVERGHITLEGYVANQADYNTMNIVARSVPGTFTVTNNLVINNDRAG
ncbi:MAG: BON domain-containing protein [Chloracidobacterium sp.]|nr:BON domain-containing protein [Chloracidobacterium sp.]